MRHGAIEMSLPLDLLRSAAREIAQRLPPSPVLRMERWRTAANAPIWIKAECLMPTGSFKIRGATLRISALSADERRRGVIAYSTGNHAQAVAKAAADAGVAATIVMSPDVPAAKVAATRAWGARVVMAAPSSQARRELAEKQSADSGAVLIPPYDDIAIMAGQASIAFELLEQLARTPPAAVFVPVGGGGLLAGIAAAIKQTAPAIQVIGVEPAWEADATQSFREGRIVSLPAPSASIADAIKVQSLGERTFPLIRQYVDDIVTVSEAEIASACLRYFDEAHLVVEPGGAVSLAAALRSHAGGDERPVVAVAGGGNVTLDRLHALRSLASAGDA